MKDENSALKTQLADLRCEYSLLEGRRSDMEKTLGDRATDIQSLEMQIQSLNAEAAQSPNSLQSELSQMRSSFDDKVHECETVDRCSP